MPALKNERREKFAQAWAAGMRGIEAYRTAGYSCPIKEEGQARTVRTNASRLRRTPEVAQRIEELMQKSEKDYTVRKGDRKLVLLGRAEKIYERSMQIEAVKGPNSRAQAICPGCGEKIDTEFKFDGKVACKALEMMMIEEGMLVKRTDVRHGKLDPLEGTREEIRAKIEALAEKVGYRLERVVQPLQLVEPGDGARDAGDAAESGSAPS